MFGHDTKRRGRAVARACARIAGCAVATAIAFVAADARAFVVKRTPGGAPVHWPESKVTFVVDPSVEAAVPGGAAAVAAAVGAWSGSSGAPILSTSAPASTGAHAAMPAVDGTNTILYAPNGYAPAGPALAVTLVAYDDETGEIVDTDVVINGAHAFAVLAASARAAQNAAPFSNESGGSDDDSSGPGVHAPVFDLEHVVAHEIGHALGLADEDASQSAVMYAYSMPGDASLRGPTTDDADGLDVLYAASGSSSSGGCSVVSAPAGARADGERAAGRDGWAAWALAVGAAAWVGARKRRKSRVPFSMYGSGPTCCAGPVEAPRASFMAERSRERRDGRQRDVAPSGR